MRACDFRLSVLGGVAIGLLAFAVPAGATVTSGAAALATSLDDAWRACNAPQLSSAGRIAHCTTIIESGRAKPVALALKPRALAPMRAAGSAKTKVKPGVEAAP
jgi:hypothetical protein